MEDLSGEALAKMDGKYFSPKESFGQSLMQKAFKGELVV
jgi:hypothetical protein